MKLYQKELKNIHMHLQNKPHKSRNNKVIKSKTTEESFKFY